MNLYKKSSSIIVVSTLLFSASCTTNPYTGEQQASKAATYGVGGAAAGALTGLLIGGNGKSALIGGAVGAAAGGGYGYYRDVQEKKLREVLKGTGVQVKKEGDNIRLIMPGNITFTSGQDSLKGSFFKTLQSVALVLKEYNKTKILVSGHTDSLGSDQDNVALSQNRAEAVSEYFISQGVDSSRLDAVGYGSSQPIASNTSESGRAQNRRAEITLMPLK